MLTIHEKLTRRTIHPRRFALERIYTHVVPPAFHLWQAHTPNHPSATVRTGTNLYACRSSRFSSMASSHPEPSIRDGSHWNESIRMSFLPLFIYGKLTPRTIHPRRFALERIYTHVVPPAFHLWQAHTPNHPSATVRTGTNLYACRSSRFSSMASSHPEPSIRDGSHWNESIRMSFLPLFIYGKLTRRTIHPRRFALERIYTHVVPPAFHLWQAHTPNHPSATVRTGTNLYACRSSRFSSMASSHAEPSIRDGSHWNESIRMSFLPLFIYGKLTRRTIHPRPFALERIYTHVVPPAFHLWQAHTPNHPSATVRTGTNLYACRSSH